MASLASLSDKVLAATLATFNNARGNALGQLEYFFKGPGRTSRIIALAVVLYNWKSLPFAWTFRVWGSLIEHFAFRRFHTHTPDKLFHHVITPSHVSLLEVDYYLHKSNSTYFADLDVGRSQLVSHLFARGCHAISRNAATKLVMDPSNPGKPARGKFGVALGAVHCSFKKELQPYQSYEMWTRVLSWDRKWLYIVTHFVEKGAVRPRSWDASVFGPTRKTEGTPQDWQKHIHATAVSKYVFKVGRLTVHPAMVMEASGMLPERPGGWLVVEDDAVPSSLGDSGEIVPEPEVDDAEATGWDWKRTEQVRKKGHDFAMHFAEMDGLHGHFDGGEDGALGIFGIA